MCAMQPDKCAICRHDINGHCLECAQGGEDRACWGPVTGARCGHTFHRECIRRWLRVRVVCPLCNGDWVYPRMYTLKELAAAKFMDNDRKIIELVNEDMDPVVYTTLDHGLRTWPGGEPNTRLPNNKKRLLAHTFAQYLELDELEELVVLKKQRVKK